ncbi:hypothetical protein [Nitrosomonas communis]|uniref:Uncharacterized protein n=1 Tax=Nitrosomonas communis TaxID=44574 RepID=A0A1H2SSC9_9PROT|nr:hypothetical protein [Nitrosomonas communis]SDW34510.1 hypothetical protein SAMN05421882_100843 [Nitrosomonas communis]
MNIQKNGFMARPWAEQNFSGTLPGLPDLAAEGRLIDLIRSKPSQAVR